MGQVTSPTVTVTVTLPKPSLSAGIKLLRTGRWNATYQWCSLESYMFTQLSYKVPLIGKPVKFYQESDGRHYYMFTLVTSAGTTLTDCQGKPISVSYTAIKRAYTPNQLYYARFDGDSQYAPVDGRFSAGQMPPF